jgi:protease-4
MFRRYAWMLMAALCLFSGNTQQLAAQEAKADAEAGVEEPKPRVAVFRLAGEVTEVPTDEALPFGSGPSISLRELVARLKKAREDKAVKAAIVLVEGGGYSLAQAEELRQAMTQFRAAGKEIYSHADSLEMGTYVLLSGASRLSVVPTGDLWVIGMSGESPYLAGLLEKIGVQPDFLTCGEFKSAAEIFMRKGPSPQAEKMQNWLLDGLYETEVSLIASGRKVDAAKVKGWIDNGPYSAEKAKEAGLIDAVEHRADFLEQVKQKVGDKPIIDLKYGQKKGPQVDFSSPMGILNFYGELLSGPKKKTYKTSVAIVHVDGPIVLGSPSADPLMGSGGAAASTTIRKALEKCLADDTIKAVVLRVSSPGGSATASEIILDATKRLKAKKPFVVSMGSVAASGGYYVSCASDTIFADESTITGSIGVVGGKLATTGLWDKVGISWKSYRRGQNAGLLSGSQIFSDAERKKMQSWMDDIYGVFKGHVTAIRRERLKKPIDELAGGRVYTGKQALELGLVDKLGTLEDAIKFVAAEAKMEDYEVRTVPEPKNFVELLMSDLQGGDSDKQLSLTALAPRTPSLWETALPMLQGLDPERLRAVRQAFIRLELLRSEGAVLMAPEMTFGR